MLLLAIVTIRTQGVWEYFPQPTQIFYSSNLIKGTVIIDYSTIVPTNSYYQEISILLSWYTGTIGGSNSYLITLENADGSPYKHYSRDQTYDSNQLSSHTENFVLPVCKSKKLYLTSELPQTNHFGIRIEIVGRR